MKTTIRFLLLLLLPQPARLQAQELKLWYSRPAEKWTEALPLGNGRIGAMVFGGVENDRIQFNEETLWTGGPREYHREDAWKNLEKIRQLLFEGRQQEAEALAGQHFMGQKSPEGDRAAWVKQVTDAAAPAAIAFDDSGWKPIPVPSYEGWEAVGYEGLDGAVWYRTTFFVPEDWLGQDLVLDLNRVRDEDRTYVNGRLAGSAGTPDPRRYVIAKDLVHAGPNVLAIQVLNFTDKGGIAGYKDTTRHIGIYPAGREKLKRPLNGQWKFFIQDDNPPPVGAYQASYQPFGNLHLHFGEIPRVSGYRRELDIENAIVTTAYTADGVHFKREYLVSQPAQVLAIQLTASEKNSIAFEALLDTPHNRPVLRKVNDSTLALSLRVKHGAMTGESHLQVRVVNGVIAVTDSSIRVHCADEATVYLAAGTNFIRYDDVSGDPSARCEEALAAGTFDQVKTAHIREYRQYFDRFYIDLGPQAVLPTDDRLRQFAAAHDPAFVALYAQYGRYLLISSSRPGTQPANLQGIWNDLLTPPWGSKYTVNINTEMNYWPAELLNLSPMHEPLFEMIKELSVTGQATARAHYKARGWVLHHNTDLWRGTAPINAANHGIWVTGGAWLCQHLWEHYLFTRDEKFLQERAYPVMKQAALFFVDFLVKDPVSGYLISTPSNSPEHGGLVAGPAMDHQLIRELFKNTIAAGQVLKKDRRLRKLLQETYRQLAPDRKGRYGQLQEWLQDVDDTTSKHRHVSHLWAVHPGHAITWDDTPELMKAARQSLLYRGDEATGWSLGWKINLWARFRDSERTFRLLRLLLSPATGNAGSYPNLLDAHPPFQIDGNFGGAAGIGEMLLQSHTGYIDILPALPAALSDGRVKGLCARGGFEIDLDWANGQLRQITIVSKAGMPLVLRYNNKVVKSPTVRNGIYTFNGSLEKQ